MLKNADDDEKVPIRYSLSSIDSLYQKFLSESHLNVIHCILRKTSLSICVIKPNPNNLGTCLCSKCLNPELKLEALAKAIQDNCLKWNDK